MEQYTEAGPLDVPTSWGSLASLIGNLANNMSQANSSATATLAQELATYGSDLSLISRGAIAGKGCGKFLGDAILGPSGGTADSSLGVWMYNGSFN